MRWRAAYSIMDQRQRFKNSWGSPLCLVLSARLSLCMSSTPVRPLQVCTLLRGADVWLNFHPVDRVFVHFALSPRTSLFLRVCFLLRNRRSPPFSLCFCYSCSVSCSVPFSNMNHKHKSAFDSEGKKLMHLCV